MQTDSPMTPAPIKLLQNVHPKFYAQRRSGEMAQMVQDAMDIESNSNITNQRTMTRSTVVPRISRTDDVRQCDPPDAILGRKRTRPDTDDSDAPPLKRIKECCICLETYNSAEFVRCVDCSHEFCQKCTVKQVTTAVSNFQTKLRCLGSNCPGRIDYSFVNVDMRQRSGEDENTANKYDDMLLREHLSNDPDWRQCPKASCKGGNYSCSSSDPTVLECSVCREQYCAVCLEPWQSHSGISCTDIASKHSDPDTEQWKTRNTRECPKCHITVEKTGGCWHMTCRHCGTEWCWLCGQIYEQDHIPKHHGTLLTAHLLRAQQRNNGPLVQAILRDFLHPHAPENLNVSITTQPAAEQVGGTKLYPPPVIQLDTNLLFRQRIDISLIDSNNAVVKAGIMKANKRLRVERHSIIFDNLKLAKKGKIMAAKSSGSTSQFRLKFDIAGQRHVSTSFSVYSSAAKLPLTSKRSRRVQHSTIVTAE